MRVWDMRHPLPCLPSADAGAGAGAGTESYPVCVGIGLGHTEGVGCVTVSSRQRSYDEGRAAIYSASGDKILKRWDLHALLKPLAAPDGGGSRVTTSEQAVKGLQGIMPAGDGGELRVTITRLLQNTATPLVCTHSVRAHDKDINCTTLAPNDAILATGSQDKTIKLWGADSLTPLATLRGHKRGK